MHNPCPPRIVALVLFSSGGGVLTDRSPRGPIPREVSRDLIFDARRVVQSNSPLMAHFTTRPASSVRFGRGDDVTTKPGVLGSRRNFLEAINTRSIFRSGGTGFQSRRHTK